MTRMSCASSHRLISTLTVLLLASRLPAAVPEPESAVVADKATEPTTKYLLRYRLAEGDVLRYRTRKVGQLCYTLGESSKRDSENVDQIRRFEVRGVDGAGTADVVMQFESVTMSLRVNDEAPVVYRSSMKPSEVPRCFAQVADRLNRSAPAFSLTPLGAPVNDQQEIVVPDQEGGSAETRLLMPLPEAEVAIGDRWTWLTRVKVRLTEEIQRDVRLLTTCRLVSVEGNVARLEFSTSPVSPVKSVAARAQLVSALPRGHCLMDLETGRLVRRVLRHSENVHGVHGPQSLLTYSSETIEEYLPGDATVTQR